MQAAHLLIIKKHRDGMCFTKQCSITRHPSQIRVNDKTFKESSCVFLLYSHLIPMAGLGGGGVGGWGEKELQQERICSLKRKFIPLRVTPFLETFCQPAKQIDIGRRKSCSICKYDKKMERIHMHIKYIISL